MANTAPNTSQVAKTAWLEVFLLWFAGISAAMQFAKFSISYPAVLEHYQVGPTWTGAALSVVGVVGLLFGVGAGMMAGRIGYRKVLIGALLLGAIMSLIQSSLPAFEWVLLTRVLEGFSQLGVVVAAPTMIAKLSAPQHRSLTMGLWGTFFGVAFAISGSIGKAILVNFDLAALYFAHACFIGLMALMLLWMLERDESRYTTPQAPSEHPFLRRLAIIYQTPRTLLPGLVFVFYTCTLVSLLTYIPSFVADPTLRSTLQVVLPLLSTAGTFLAGTLSQYWMKPQRVAQLAYLSLAISAIALWVSDAQSIWFGLLIGMMILSAGLVPGASLAMIPRLARNSDEQANGYGLIAQLGNLGATVGPPSFAAVIALFGLTGLVGLVLFICTMGSVFAYLAWRIESA